MDSFDLTNYSGQMCTKMKFLKPEEFTHNLNKIFEELRSRINRTLPDVEVEHIGSSAIRNAISKGDLDILVRVAPEQFDRSLVAIQKLGFKIKEDTLRTESLCMLFTEEFTEDVAIQLIVRGSEFEDFVKFRDRLNADSNLVDQYNQLKLESVSLDADEYRAKKSKFIENVLAD